MSAPVFRVGVVYHGPPGAQDTAAPANSKVPAVFPALAEAGIEAHPVVWNDAVAAEAIRRLMAMDGLLVWVNPIEGGRDRTRLDAALREAAAAGVFVSTHPDVILKLGTKQVLVDTGAMSWSAPGTLAHRTVRDLAAALAGQMAAGQSRVLKQYRGHSGDGIWKVEPDDGGVRVRHAKRGSPEERLSLAGFLKRCEPYFDGEGRMINQPYQARLPEGMIRCYLVRDRVEGFGHQAVNALCPPLPGTPAGEFPPTTSRLYHPPTLAPFQRLKRQLEDVWVPELSRTLHLGMDELPLLWDCDFLLGPRDAAGDDTYVLCEINVSSVSPFPESALRPLALATRAAMGTSAGRGDG
jgi:hypothetical protein